MKNDAEKLPTVLLLRATQQLLLTFRRSEWSLVEVTAYCGNMESNLWG
jgi:hypothetical protein